MTYLKELNTLENYLKEHDIPYRRIDDTADMVWNGNIYDRHIIMVFKDYSNMSNTSPTRLWDAICQRGSYGHSSGLLEVSGSIVSKEFEDEGIEGWLFASEIIERLEKEKEANND